MQNTDELDISLFDIFRALVLKWKILIVGAVIGGILLGVFAAMKSEENGKLDISEEDKLEVEKIIELENKYSEGKTEIISIMERCSPSEFSADEYNYIKSINEIFSLLENSKKNLTSNQGSYYNMLKNGEEETISSSNSILKNAVLGAFIGIVCICVYVTITFCFSGKLRSKHDLVSLYNLYDLGEIKIVKGTAHTDDSILDNVVFAVKNANVDTVVFSVPKVDKVKSVITVLAEELSKKGVDVVEYDSPISVSDINFESKKKIGMVLVEQIGFSKYELITKEIDLLKRYEIFTLGSITIQ